jgi:threonine/homoserine efflux transporter RhtA
MTGGIPGSGLRNCQATDGPAFAVALVPGAPGDGVGTVRLVDAALLLQPATRVRPSTASASRREVFTNEVLF